MRGGKREIKNKKKPQTLCKEKNRGKLILKFTKEEEGPGKEQRQYVPLLKGASWTQLPWHSFLGRKRTQKLSPKGNPDETVSPTLRRSSQSSGALNLVAWYDQQWRKVQFYHTVWLRWQWPLAILKQKCMVQIWLPCRPENRGHPQAGETCFHHTQPLGRGRLSKAVAGSRPSMSWRMQVAGGWVWMGSAQRKIDLPTASDLRQISAKNHPGVTLLIVLSQQVDHVLEPTLCHSLL